MKREGCAFIDIVSGKEVNYYTDTLGRKWLANSAWSLFRVERNGSESISSNESSLFSRST